MALIFRCLERRKLTNVDLSVMHVPFVYHRKEKHEPKMVDDSVYIRFPFQIPVSATS